MYVPIDGEELVFPLGHHTIVFQAEVYALLICAKLESLLHRNNCSIAICSDSLSAIKAVSAHKATSGLVADAMSALKTLALYNSLHGIAGNKKADALAKQASAFYSTGPEPSVGISVSTVYSSINEWTVHEQN